MKILKKGLAACTALLLTAGAVVFGPALAANAHTGDLKVKSVCDTTTGEYVLTATLDITQTGLAGQTRWRVGTGTFQGTPTNANGMDRGPVASNGAGTITLGETRLPGTTTGLGPWIYAFTTWSDNFSKGSDGQLTTALKGNCLGTPTEVPAPPIEDAPATCQADGYVPVWVNNPPTQNPNGRELPGTGTRVYFNAPPVAPGTYNYTIQKIGPGFDPNFPNGTKVVGKTTGTVTVEPRLTVDCTPTSGEPKFETAQCVPGKDKPQGSNSVTFPVVEGGQWNAVTANGTVLTDIAPGTYGEADVKQYGYGEYKIELVDRDSTDAFKVAEDSWTHEFVDPEKDCRILVETPAIDLVQVGECGTYGTVTPTNGEHVTRNQVDFNRETGDYTVTFFADEGYKFSNGEATITVTGNVGAYVECPAPLPPTFVDVCQTANDSYSVPEDTDVYDFEANDTRVEGVGNVMVTATVKPGHGDTQGNSWSFDFTNEDCPIAVKPEAPTAFDKCGTADDGLNIPDDTEFFTYKGVLNEESAVVEAVANPGYFFPEGVQTRWTFEFDTSDCPIPNVPVSAERLATTGVSLLGAQAALALLFVGAALMLVKRRRATQN